MTCIVAVKEDNTVYIGADSLGSNGYYKAIYKNRKVFKAKDNKDILIAICGGYKLQNILSVEEDLVEELKHLKNQVDFEHMVKYVSPKIMTLATKYGCIINKDGMITLDGSLFFAYRNQLYWINYNGEVLEPSEDYLADGSGINFALSILSQNHHKPTIVRIEEALKAAEKHGCGVEKPFYIMNTKNEDVIEIL